MSMRPPLNHVGPALANLMAFCASECLAAHAALDRVGVPRELDGEKLSVTQRVEVLVGAYKSSCERVSRGE